MTLHQGDQLLQKNANLRHCASADLAISAGLAKKFVDSFQVIADLSDEDRALRRGSISAVFYEVNQMWIFNPINKQNYKDLPPL